MAIGAAQTPQEEQSAKSTYICTGATVEGLPKRGFLKSEARYSVTTVIDGKELWKSREIKSKEQTADWNGDDDTHQFQCGSSSTLQVTVYQKVGSEAVEMLGVAEASVTSWLQASDGIFLVLSAAHRIKGEVRVTLRLTQHAEMSATLARYKPLPLVPVRLTSILPYGTLVPATGDLYQGAIDKSDGLKDVVKTLESTMEPIFDNIDWFMTAVDALPEVHAYAKTAWSVFSELYKLMHAQRRREAKLMDLLEIVAEVYMFLREARELQTIIMNPGRDPVRERVLCQLFSQTVECGQFISGQVKDSTFFRRLFKQSISGVDGRISDYQDSFASLKQAFQDGPRIVTVSSVLAPQDSTAVITEPTPTRARPDTPTQDNHSGTGIHTTPGTWVAICAVLGGLLLCFAQWCGIYLDSLCTKPIGLATGMVGILLGMIGTIVGLLEWRSRPEARSWSARYKQFCSLRRGGYPAKPSDDVEMQ